MFARGGLAEKFLERGGRLPDQHRQPVDGAVAGGTGSLQKGRIARRGDHVIGDAFRRGMAPPVPMIRAIRK